ncbi:diacylglycerol kinase eta-like [Phycodurus eques]|uniref:diacylglycerol kinase eta-like n=1 Tax=Phycodurus eques TaxID=693459 RepID=UPI002ACEE557|nr:diacylglycerol kinase eta-like [Phycodurus eques]
MKGSVRGTETSLSRTQGYNPPSRIGREVHGPSPNAPLRPPVPGDAPDPRGRQDHKLVEQELAHAVNASATVLTKAKLSSPEFWSRSTAVEIVNSSKVLQAETTMLLDGKHLSEFPEEEGLRFTLNSLSAELHKLDDIHRICPLTHCAEEEHGMSSVRLLKQNRQATDDLFRPLTLTAASEEMPSSYLPAPAVLTAA